MQLVFTLASSWAFTWHCRVRDQNTNPGLYSSFFQHRIMKRNLPKKDWKANKHGDSPEQKAKVWEYRVRHLKSQLKSHSQHKKNNLKSRHKAQLLKKTRPNKLEWSKSNLTPTQKVPNTNCQIKEWLSQSK